MSRYSEVRMDTASVLSGDQNRAQQSTRLDALRGVAAFAVVLGHTRAMLMSVQAAHGGFIESALLVPSAFAEEAVAVFFVLSGYLVGGQVLRQMGDDRFSWGTYLAKRFSRLWTVLLPGLLFTLLLDTVSAAADPAAFSLMLGRNHRDLGTLLCNAAFLNPTRCTSYGSDDSLWSLSYEFWFYMLFAAITWAVWGAARRRWRRIAVGAVLTTSVQFAFGWSIVPYIAAWMMGVVVAWAVHTYPRTLIRRAPMFAAAGLTLLSMIATTVLELPRVTLQIVVGLVASFLVYSLVTTSTRRLSWITERAALVGRWSYSMYVFHRPMVILVLCLAEPAFVSHSEWRVPIVYSLAVVVAALSYPLYWITERHTGVVRQWMMRCVGR